MFCKIDTDSKDKAVFIYTCIYKLTLTVRCFILILSCEFLWNHDRTITKQQPDFKQRKQNCVKKRGMNLELSTLRADFFLTETHKLSISIVQLTLVWPQWDTQEMNVVSDEGYEPRFCWHPHWFIGQNSALCGSTTFTIILKSKLTLHPPDLCGQKGQKLFIPVVFY